MTWTLLGGVDIIIWGDILHSAILDTENLETTSLPQVPPLLLVLSDCDSGSNSPGLFDPGEPTGEYKLDMSLPYSRMVTSELLALSEEKKGYEVR